MASGDAHKFPCPGCGADLAFDPGRGGLTCPYCGRQEAIPQSAAEVVERSYEEYLRVKPEQLQVLAEGAREVTCEGCGATITFTPPQVSAFCPFCGRNRVSQGKSADPMLAPQAVLPFALSKDQARQSVRSWLHGLWFAPNALKTLARQQAIAGVYLPFWTYDSHTTSFYQGERGTFYYVDEAYVENGVRKTRRVRHTRWTQATGSVALWHDDVLVPATQSVPPPRLHALEPWDFAKLVDYDAQYLAGFEAQRYALDLAGGFEEAKGLMEGPIREAARSDIGGDDQRVHDVSTSYSAVTFKHILLPVYLGAYTFRDTIYQILVNARSGEVTGDRPYSVWKILGAALLALIVVLIVVAVTRD